MTLGKRKAGRHVEFDEAEGRVALLIDLLRSGCFFKEACAYAGLNRATVYRWLARPEFSEFRDTVERAKAFASIVALARIMQAAQGRPAVIDPVSGRVIKPAIPPNWRVDAWYLSTVDPYNFGGRIIEGEGVTLREILDAIDDEAFRDQLILGFRKKWRGRRHKREELDQVKPT